MSGIKVAEFFVDLGIKGNAKTKDALTGVHTTLKEAKEASWELKAGIFGAVVALEEITRHAVGTAVDLKNFAGATGLSTAELQKWAYWAEINDVKADSMAQSIKGLQSAQSALRLGQGVPAGAVYFGLNQNNNPLEMIHEIQKKLRAIGNDQKEIGNARTMFSTLNAGGDDMFAALRIGTVGFAGLTKQMQLNQQEQKELLGLNRQWHEFWLTLRGSSDKMVANNLSSPISEFVHTLKNAVVEVSELADKFHLALKKFSPDELTAFKVGFEGLTAALIASLVPMGPWIIALIAVAAALDQIYKYTHGQKSLLGDTIQAPERLQKTGGISGTVDRLKNHKVDVLEASVADTFGAFSGLGKLITSGLKPDFVGPPAPAQMNLKVTNHITEAGDAEETAKQISESIMSAVLQNPAFNSLVPAQPKGGQ